MNQYISTFAELCQTQIDALKMQVERRPEQNKWIKLGLKGTLGAVFQEDGTQRVIFSLPNTDCSEDDATSYCQGDSSSNAYQAMVWNQRRISVAGFQFSDENLCDDNAIATFLSGEAFRKVQERILNLIDKVDKDVFNQLLGGGYIKNSISGVDKIVLGGISQDGMPWANPTWNAKLKAWEAQNFAGSSNWDYVSGQDAGEFNSRAGVGEGAETYIHQSRHVEAGKIYQVKEGSYYFMQKAALKAGFYSDDRVLTYSQLFRVLNDRKEQEGKQVFLIREPQTGIVITLVVVKDSTDCDSLYSKWVITPLVEYQLFVPQPSGGCTYPAPHIYRYDICGIPEPVCQSHTPAYAAPGLCLTAGAPVGCSSAIYGSLVSIAGGSVSGSGAIIAPSGADVSTVLGQAIAINAALAGVVNGGQVFINAAGALEYQGSTLAVGTSYTITLACGGTLSFTLADCANVLQPVNVVLPSIVMKTAFNSFTQDGTGANDSVLRIVINGMPDITIGLPMNDVSGVQAAIDAYFISNGAVGGITYQYIDAPNGSQAVANFIAVTNLDVSFAELEVNGTSPVSEAFV